MIKFKTLPSIMAAIIITISLFSPMTAEAASEEQIRNKIVSVATAEVGYAGTSTYSKYGEWFGYQGGWCTTFVLWCYNQTDCSLGTSLYGNAIPSGGNCNSMISWYESKGRYHKRGDGYTPKAGDLVFFDWSGNGSSQHVGIVDYISGSTVYTVEGNCSGQVKAREYTASGSKPYNNISAIMGYASPEFSRVSDGSSNKTTVKKTTAQKTTSEKSETKKQITTATKKTTVTTTEKTTEIIKAEKLSLAYESYELKIGDTVQLDYSIEPKNSRAVVEYFCDEEGIIDVKANGDITAVGTGNATVVVCANNDIYSQCSVTVGNAVGEVTALSPEPTSGTDSSEENATSANTESLFTEAGINLNLLIHNRQLCIILISIVIAVSAAALIINTLRKARKK